MIRILIAEDEQRIASFIARACRRPGSPPRSSPTARRPTNTPAAASSTRSSSRRSPDWAGVRLRNASPSRACLRPGLPRAPRAWPRLVESARTLTNLTGTAAVTVLGPVDAPKLWSSMMLFAQTAPHECVFPEVLDQYFGGKSDPATTSIG